MSAVVENPRVRYFRGCKMSNKQSLLPRTPSLTVMKGGVRIEGKFGMGRNNTRAIGWILLLRC